MPIEVLDASAVTAKPLGGSFETLDALPTGVTPVGPQGGVPASGPFPAVPSPQSSTPVSAPPPSDAPTVTLADPGILGEAYNDAVKGTHSFKRGMMLGGFMGNVPESLYGGVDNLANHLAASKDIEAKYPASVSTQKAAEELATKQDQGWGGLLPSLGYYATHPRLAVSTTIQSLPTMLPMLATVPIGAAIGSLAGAPGAVAGGILGLGAGSGMSDFGNAFEDYARDKWKPQTAADWKVILTDPEKYTEAGTYAAKHAGMVGAFDALGGKLGGKLAMGVAGQLAERGLGKVARGGAGLAAGTVADAAVGAAGEAAGQMAGYGTLELHDPTAVAGEFAGGFLTGAAGASIEPVIHHLNIGGARATPVTPADVTAATGALMPAPAASEVSGTYSAVAPQPVFYSPLRRHIEEKGQSVATADQWLNTLNNAPGIKQEEIADTKLNQLLVDNPNKVTKKELLDHLDENAIRIEETHRNNLGTFAYNADGTTNIEGTSGRPRGLYEDYTLPGERQGYTEVNLHLPTRNVEGDNTQRDFVGGHYPEPNTVVHYRITDRQDVNGVPTALIEEIQADLHQAGRKRGYVGQEMTNPAFMDAIDERIGQHLDTTNDRRSPLFRAFTGGEGHALTEAVRAGVITQEEATRYERDMRGTNPVPDLPFKHSWDELAFKRILRWAADQGYRRIAWVNAAEQSRRYPGSAKRDQGMQKFYDQIIPSIAKKWAKRLGGTMGETRLGDTYYDVRNADGDHIAMRSNEEDAKAAAELVGGTYTPAHPNAVTVQHIDIPQAGVDLIQRGLPMYSERAKKPGATLDELASAPRAIELGRQLGPALDEVIKQLKLTVSPKLILHEKLIVIRNPNGRNETINALGMARAYRSQQPEIHIALGQHKTAAEVWGTMTHELGHIVMEDKFETASAEVKTAIRAAYDEFRANTPHNENMRQFIARRDNAMIAYHNTRQTDATTTLMNYGPAQRQYWTGFEEWFAEQVARWATTNVKPLSSVERFFKGLGMQIIGLLEAATKQFNLSFQAAPAMVKWLNSFHTDAAPFAENVVTQNTVETTGDNQRQMGPEEKAVERQPETIAAREGINKLFDGRPPKEVQVAAAYADKFNKIYKWMLGIHQVAQRNKHIQPLQEYTETIAVAQLIKQQIMIRAQEVLKAWNRLGGRMGDAVAALIDDVQNMVYLTPDETKNNVARFPTQAELGDLVKKHGVSQEGLAVFKQVADTFNEHLTRYEAVLRNEAMKITDVTKQTERMDAITRQIANLRSRPYFPAMRFGDYTITVRNDAGQVIHFETFEKRRKQELAAEAIRAQYGVSKANMELGKMDRTVRPLMGVPTQLLELMAKKLELNVKQRDALEQMKFELSPAQSFKHRFQHKQRIAGYSQDFRRAYANYFFHGANHLMKAMYADKLRGLKDATGEATKGYDMRTRHDIVAYMNDHLENWLDPKSDWAQVRSIAFLWSLAFTPAAAAQNLTQTLMTTYPFLAQQFGDVKAVAALMRTGADFTTFYKKGALNNATEFQLRAIGRGIKDGIINEAMAPELAGFAEGRTLGLGFGGNELQRGLHTFNEWGAKMFELAEQVNRRLVFRAALKLASENPGAKYNREMVTKHKLHYDQLRTEGWTEAEATAYVAARDATITTQFQYGREYAPRIFRGKARSVFVFKTFIQNYVVFLANYPQAAVRSLLIMGFLGGLFGVPGGDDLKEILKAIGWQMFGKDFDIEKEARRLIIQLLGEDENGRNAADMILHGVARQGYGIPAVMDMLGGTVGVDIPMPVLDRSKAISAGTLLPLELGKLFGPPVQDPDAVISGQAQKASGAVFGAGFNVYKALTNNKVSWSDSKRWERAVPRAMGSLAKAYRVGTEGRERTSTGSTLVSYDVRDTQQLAEVIAMAGGYSPYRQSLQWDRVMAGQEAVKLWDFRRTILMKQMGNAVLGKDPKEIERVKGAIQTFNGGLPNEARGKAISSEALHQSIGTQARSRAAQESESSAKKSDIPILREVQKLYPESRATSVRKVPKNLQ